jgi:signal transduction histidine kinase
MGLRLRLILIITIPAVLAVGVHGLLRVRQQEAQLFAAEQQSLRLTAKAVQIAVENAFRHRQFSDVGRLISEMVEQQEMIDRIRLFDRRLALTFVSNPLAIGEAVPAGPIRRVLESGASQASWDRRARQSFISVITPIRGGQGSVEGAMEIVRLAGGIDERLRAAIADVLIRLGLVVAVTIGLTALALQRQVLRPLARLTAGIQQLGHGDGGAPLPVERDDELGKVAREFNAMAARLHQARARLIAETERALELEDQARRAATVAVAGKLAAGLAHEVGTPLNVISVRAEFILRALPPDDPRRADLESIVGQIERISRIITGLLDAVRPQAPKLEPTAVKPLVDDLFGLLRHPARQRGVELVVSVPDGLPRVQADAGQLQQVVINLVLNALEATPGGGRVTVGAEARARGSRDGVALTVSDTGSGIAPEILPNVFNAFFTTKPRGQGTGLGLAICRDIVRSHGGEILVDSQPGAGSTFTAWIPADTGAPA